MAAEPIDDIVTWSEKLAPWRRDCLRRLAISNDLADTDHIELLAMIKGAAGFESEAPEPIAFTKAHFSGGKQQPIILKGIANIEGVNRLVSQASLTCCPKALTIVFGRNGSGKSGFVRIFRTACRTRVENPGKLKVLADVYGSGSGPQSANIVIDTGAGEVTINWKPGMAAAPQLMQVAVFDTASAQLYVDGGNQIRFLPFGLALPHRLNTVCLALKQKLEQARAIEVGDKIGLTAISFPVARDTAAQQTNRSLGHQTTDEQIEQAATFDSGQQTRLDALTETLLAGATAQADLHALLGWTVEIAADCATSVTAFSDEQLAACSSLKNTAIAARQAAAVAAEQLFTDEPLHGIGSESWRALWLAARDYSLREAYPGKDFPVIGSADDAAACLLCQQPLAAEGRARMQRFQAYMEDALDAAANQAEEALQAAVACLFTPKTLHAGDFGIRLEQIRQRDSGLADAISVFQQVSISRRSDAARRLAGETGSAVTALGSPHNGITSLIAKLKDELAALAKATDQAERAKLMSEKAELEDRKILALNKTHLQTRRDLKAVDYAYNLALAEVQTKAITQRANELVDTHLTKAVVNRFNAERERFDIAHLKVGLARKSGQTKAEFDVDPQTKLTKITSDILSEGEQRALALAGFLTEVALTDGSGPIIIDDPVSSLDRERSTSVAQRLAEEAKSRQVVVFTHDIVFFNELSRAAEDIGIEPVTVAVFSDGKDAGKIDQAGMIWKGLPVGKRIGQLKNDLPALSKEYAVSPAKYEYSVKGWYGRLRDTYERVVEEVIFQDIVRRGVDVIQTQKLRYVTFPDELALRFHDGMTRANTHSHDNPAADTVSVPLPNEVTADLAKLEALISDFKTASMTAEAARPQIKPKK